MNPDRRPDDTRVNETHGAHVGAARALANSDISSRSGISDAADGAEPDSGHRPKLDLSVTKIAAGAGAAALAAAVGSKLGVAGTIVGAAVASVISACAGAVLGHSLERGRTAALKARPALEAYQTERLHSVYRRHTPPGSLDATVVLDGGTEGATAPDADTVPLPPLTQTPDGAKRTGGAEQTDGTGAADGTGRAWRDRLPGRKPLIALTAASFLIGTGAVTAFTLARDGGVPGQNGSVFSPDTGRGGSHSPDPQSPGDGTADQTGGPSRHPSTPTPSDGGSTPSQPPETPTAGLPPGSGSSSSSGGATTPSTDPPTGAPTPTTGPTTAPTSGATGGGGATTAPTTPATQGTTTPNPAGTAGSATGAAGTPSGAATR